MKAKEAIAQNGKKKDDWRDNMPPTRKPPTPIPQRKVKE